MDKEFATVGYYEPGFIHLRINTSDDLNDLNKLKDDPTTVKYYSNFFHEYIHFLQDITSTHGLLNFVNAVGHIRDANQTVREDGKAEFSIPLQLDNKFNFLANAALRSIYYGDRTLVRSATYLDFKIIDEKIKVNTGAEVIVPKYIVNYFDNGAKTKMSFHFGSRCIKEYMAHALQNQLFPNTLHDDIPYTIVELIVTKEYPALAKDTSFIIALCDASLMSYHPAQFFFNTLERMKADSAWQPTDVNSIYNFGFNQLTFRHNGQIETVASLFDKMNLMAIDHFRDSLQAEVFKDNVTWFEEIANEAKKLRTTQMGFFTKFVASTGVPSPLFIEIVKKMGTPFMTNAQSKGYFLPPEKLRTLNIFPYYPKVFQAILGTYNGHKECSLFSFCETRTDTKITNEKCLTAPWTRVKDTKDLCPYAQLWRTWGLEDEIPETK